MSSDFDMIKKYVKSILNSETTGHDYFHSIRVMNNALFISKNYNVNLEIIKVAAITHDLIDEKITNNIALSLTNLRKQLVNALYNFTDIKKIIEIIQTISYSKGKIPTSLEGKIVQDADRLDALGAVGIARTFAYGGKNNRMIYNQDKDDKTDSLSHFHDKLLKLSLLMNTKEGKNIAKKRTEYMLNYLDVFDAEWKGKDLD